MKITENRNVTTFNSIDNNGEWELRLAITEQIQLQMHTREGEVYANINRKELIELKRMIDNVIEETKFDNN